MLLYGINKQKDQPEKLIRISCDNRKNYVSSVFMATGRPPGRPRKPVPPPPIQPKTLTEKQEDEIRETYRLLPKKQAEALKLYQVGLENALGLKIILGLLLAGYTEKEIAELKILKGAFVDADRTWFVNPYQNLIALGQGPENAELIEQCVPTVEGMQRLIHQEVVKTMSSGLDDESKTWIQYLNVATKALDAVKQSVGSAQILESFKLVSTELNLMKEELTKPIERNALNILIKCIRQIKNRLDKR